MQLSLNCALSYLLMLCLKLCTWQTPTLRTGWCTVLCKRNESGCRRNSTNCELSIQTKKWLNLDASIVLTTTKFRMLDDEPKRNFAGDFNCALSENDKKGGNPVWKKSIVIKEVQNVANLYQFNRHLARSQSERQPLHLKKQIAKSPMPTRLLFNFKRTQQWHTCLQYN